MIFLVEFGVHDGAALSTLYLATDGYTSKPTDAPSNQYYMPRLRSAGSIERHMFASGDGVSGGTTRGGGEAGFGTIQVVNGRPYGGSELIDSWVNLAFRSVTIRSLDTAKQALVQATTRFVGVAEQLVATNAIDQFEIRIYDRTADLDRPLLTHAYAGTTLATGQGIEGETDLTDQIKPKIWGRKNNVSCVAVNIYDLIYQVSDGPINSIAVYDGGLALTSSGDFGSLASLQSASLVPGSYGTCLSLGIFRLGGVAYGTLTADVVEGATEADRTIGQIAARMLSWLQSMYPTISVSFAPGTVAALDALNSAEAGIIVEGTETAQSAFGRLLGSIGAWMLPVSTSASQFELGILVPPAGSPVATFDIDDCIGGSPQRVDTGDDGRGIPATKIIVKYDQLGLVQNGEQLFGAVTTDRKSYLSTEWRQAIAEDAEVLTKWPNAPIITVESCLATQVAAQAEANRLRALYSVPREIYRMVLPLADAAACELGSVVELTSRGGRMGLADGKLFRVLGRIDDYGDLPTVTIDCWG